jgi:hypothetical protein
VTGAQLDLGRVGEAARVSVNGVTGAHLLWPPYRTAIDPRCLRPGRNRFEVLVTNSAANHYEGADRPSGLIGPVTVTVIMRDHAPNTV